MIPESVRAYTEAQWWIFLVTAPFILLVMVVFGAIAWWQERHRNDSQRSLLTKLDLTKSLSSKE